MSLDGYQPVTDDGASPTAQSMNQHDDLRHVIRVTEQLLRGIEDALITLRGKERLRLERQRRLLTRERDVAIDELQRLIVSG